MRALLIFFLCFIGTADAQLLFTDQFTHLGIIPEAYEIRGDVMLTNASNRKIFLLRADAEKGIKVLATKKTLLPGDTCLLVISFVPANIGKFTKSISLVTSDQDLPYHLEISGDLKHSLKDDKQSCFYFGSRKRSNVKIKNEPIVVNESEEKRNSSNRIPDNEEPPIQFPPAVTLNPKPGNQPLSQTKGELSLLEYKPNNIVFLVDVSASMKDSLKLPLMKQSLYNMIDAMREVDRISFITYADSVKILAEGISGKDKELLRQKVARIKAHGYTKGRKAILLSREVAERNFISEGNNQVFLATDGIFMFYSKDKESWSKRNMEQKVILSTVAFGDDKDALKNLKEIAQAGEGSFIRIKNKDSKEELLEEVKKRCGRKE